ncbi:MAG: GNAT family N-acetyltransferase [Bacteroidota bacterium]|nr:GNAT family N-acetyltransferase [Bacteroidota bacterium]
MLTINFDPYPLMTTERLSLRQIEQTDVNEIFFLRSDKKVMEFVDRPPCKSLEEASLFIEKINGSEKNNEAIQWAITLKDETTLIGTICYWNLNKENYRAEIGYVLNPQYHGKGIMQEAMTTVLDYGFRIIKLHSIEANVNPDNESSIKLLERNKFIKEAYFKENYFFDGKFLDTAIYSLLTHIEGSEELK